MARSGISLTPESQRILDGLVKAGKIDFRPTLEVIGIGYRKEVGAIFDKQQPRQQGLRWQPLSAVYAIQKARIWGNRPLLVASGSMLASMTVKGAPGNITAISKNSAIFGSSIGYGVYHDSDQPRSRLPRRNFSEPSERREQIWKDQIQADIIREFEKNGVEVEGSIFG